MKTIYFVRHGETANNAAKRLNAPNTPLSEKGMRQAEDIAERCKRIPIEVVVTSTMTRAKQTGAVVSGGIGAHMESSELFVEGSYSSRLVDKAFSDPEVRSAFDAYHRNFEDPAYRFEDGENFADLKKRALAALKFLEGRSEENILVVSHAFFMWIIAAAAVFGSDLTAEECKGVLRGFDLMENTALTVLTFDAPPRKAVGEPVSKWQLKVWNDHAHLG